MRVDGLLFDGQSSRARPAVLYRLGEQIILEFEGETRQFNVKEVQVLSRLGSAPRAIEFPGFMRFESSSHDEIDRVFGASTSLIHKLENNTELVVVSVLAFIAFCVVCYLWLIPATARFVVHKVPQSYIDKLAEKMEGDWGFGETVELSEVEQTKFDSVFKRLEKSFPDRKVRVKAVSMDGDMANAFALPDGSMMVTPPLLELLSENEILAVMMHEMGHVTHRHGLQAMAGQMIVSVLLFFTIGSTDVTNLGQMMIGLSYSRASEKEADLFAARHLKAIQLKPTLLSDGLRRIERASSTRAGGGKMPAFLSTHPLTEERAKYLRELE